ncbi:helix-turn-helix domain-containing protein [Arthrobacter sp. NPDC058127]|uniref:helix-turn-helix domain-containing protein n=1 Tax=Arthrobacter sp. NPDC058127 TaxID=3346351 RepID=UPI0036EAC725
MSTVPHDRTDEAFLSVGPTGSATPASLIVDYLFKNGASKVADICHDVGVPRSTVYDHLLRLEAAGVVRSDIAPGSRARFTPHFSLNPSAR